ncbi:MAG TPA: response regulator [Gemmataceae bacterium]|nr:response regulator [Gemmataceae bacterium]
MTATVLMADPDADLCDLYQIFLSDYGYEVETAADGLECVEKLRYLEPKLILLDTGLTWGGADGVLAWLRKERWLSPIPVIVTANSGNPSTVACDNDPPVIACLLKPFSADDLLECLHAAIFPRQREKQGHADDGTFVLDDQEDPHHVATSYPGPFPCTRAWRW